MPIILNAKYKIRLPIENVKKLGMIYSRNMKINLDVIRLIMNAKIIQIRLPIENVKKYDIFQKYKN